MIYDKEVPKRVIKYTLGGTPGGAGNAHAPAAKEGGSGPQKGEEPFAKGGELKKKDEGNGVGMAHATNLSGVPGMAEGGPVDSPDAAGAKLASAPHDGDEDLSDDTIQKAASEDSSIEDAIRAIIAENKAKGGKAAEVASMMEKKYLMGKKPGQMAGGGEVGGAGHAELINPTHPMAEGGEVKKEDKKPEVVKITMIKKGDTDGIHKFLKEAIKKHKAEGGEKAHAAEAMEKQFASTLEGYADGGEIAPDPMSDSAKPEVSAPGSAGPEDKPAAAPAEGAATSPAPQVEGMFSDYTTKGVPTKIVDAANSAIELLKNEGPGAAASQIQSVMSDLKASMKDLTGPAKKAAGELMADLQDVIHAIGTASKEQNNALRA
jgi:hypothetical protein